MTEKLRLISKETALVGLFLILLLLKDFAGVSVPSIVFTVAWILIILFCSTNVGGAFSIAAVICFASTISITIPSVVFILVALLRRQKLPKFNAMLIITFIIIFMELIRLIVVQGEVFKNYVNSMAVVLLVGTIITEMIEGNVDAKTCLKLFLLFFIFLSFDIIWATARTVGNISGIIDGSFRIGQVDLIDAEVVGILGINSNGIALLSIVAIAVSLVLLKTRRMPLWGAIVLIVYSSFVGFLTVSKTFILVLLGLFLVYFIWYIIKESKKRLTPILALIGTIILAVLLSKTTIVQNVIDRFNEGDLTTGRVEVAKEYLEFMFHNLSKVVFGIGLQSVTVKAGLIHVPHNAILEIFVCFGLIGIALFTVFFIKLFNANKNYRTRNGLQKASFLNYIPLIVYLVFIQSLQFMRISYIYASVVIVFACMLITEVENKKRG